MAKSKKVVHFGLPYSKTNRVMIPICIAHAGGLRARCGIEQGADFETVGVDDLYMVDCKKCLAFLSKRLREGGWR